MTAILTPALALRYLRQLSTDVRAAVVLATADLAVLARERAEMSAGEPARATAARATARGATARGGAVRGGSARATARGERVHAISDDQRVLAVVAGPHALLPLLHHDLATVLADMRAGRGETTPSSGVQVLERADSAVSAAIFAGLGISPAGKS